MTKEAKYHYGCIFFDSKNRTCRRLEKLSQSPGMETLKAEYQEGQIGDELMGEIMTEVYRPPLDALFFHDQGVQRWRCSSSVKIGVGKGRPLPKEQTKCDGFWGLNGQPGPRLNVTPILEEKIRMLLYTQS